jgi:hypothetical protein
LAVREPAIWQEVVRMAVEQGEMEGLDLRPLVECVGMQEIVRQLGLKQILEVVGTKQAIEAVGRARAVQELGVDGILPNLTPEQRQELLRRLEQEQQRP